MKRSEDVTLDLFLYEDFMAKGNKYLQYVKNGENRKIDIDLQQIALEYQKLLNKNSVTFFKGILKWNFNLKWKVFITF